MCVCIQSNSRWQCVRASFHICTVKSRQRQLQLQLPAGYFSHLSAVIWLRPHSWPILAIPVPSLNAVLPFLVFLRLFVVAPKKMKTQQKSTTLFSSSYVSYLYPFSCFCFYRCSFPRSVELSCTAGPSSGSTRQVLNFFSNKQLYYFDVLGPVNRKEH